jgi:hypothetical protein
MGQPDGASTSSRTSKTSSNIVITMNQQAEIENVGQLVDAVRQIQNG